MIYEDLPQGITTNSAYIVQYSEDVWFSLSEERQQYCKDTWIEFGKPLGLDEVVLRLTPDPIFPMHGKEKPYIHWRHKFPRSNDADDWAIKVSVVVTMNSDPVALNQRDIDKFKQLARNYPKSTRLCLNSLNGTPMMEYTT